MNRRNEFYDIMDVIHTMVGDNLRRFGVREMDANIYALRMGTVSEYELVHIVYSLKREDLL